MVDKIPNQELSEIIGSEVIGEFGVLGVTVPDLVEQEYSHKPENVFPFGNLKLINYIIVYVKLLQHGIQ